MDQGPDDDGIDGGDITGEGDVGDMPGPDEVVVGGAAGGQPGAPDGPGPLGRLGQRQVSGWYLVLGLAVIAVVCSFFVDSNKAVMLVGPAPRIDLQGLGPGSYRFTTVEVRPVSVGRFVLARLAGDPVVDVAGGDRDAQRRAGGASMELSQQTAWAVANSLADGGDGSVEMVAAITAVADGSPAARAGLSVGDEIVAVDEVSLRRASELPERVGASGGRELVLEVERGDEEVRIPVTPERDGATWRLGVEVAPRPAQPGADRPRIDAGGVGGASGGLMFTLAYLDALGDGDLAGGRLVSGTGTIDADGSVGRVDGVGLKVRGALDAGAAVFLVPEEIYGEAVAASAGRIEVVPVATAADAVAWLCANGGSSPACPGP